MGTLPIDLPTFGTLPKLFVMIKRVFFNLLNHFIHGYWLDNRIAFGTSRRGHIYLEWDVESLGKLRQLLLASLSFKIESCDSSANALLIQLKISCKQNFVIF